MLDYFLVENASFKNYSIEHLVCFIICIWFIMYILRLGRHKWSSEQQVKFLTIICLFGAFAQIFKVVYKYYAGIFDATNDFPLHLCNILTLLIPFVVYFKSRFFWGITFFWIIAGCAQSLFTPTLTENLPHYEAIRYWSVHAIIILAAFYGWYVFGFIPTIKDAIYSAIAMNILAAIIYPINLFLGSNYMFLNAKPAGKTFYDLLGPWPEYILMLEVAILILFSLILVPFYWQKILLFFSNNSNK